MGRGGAAGAVGRWEGVVGSRELSNHQPEARQDCVRERAGEAVRGEVEDLQRSQSAQIVGQFADEIILRQPKRLDE